MTLGDRAGENPENSTCPPSHAWLPGVSGGNGNHRQCKTEKHWHCCQMGLDFNPLSSELQPCSGLFRTRRAGLCPLSA